MEKWFGITLGVPLGLYFLRQYLCGVRYTKNTRIDGKVVIITGGNSGLGLESAVDLAKRGGKIYIACRDIKRGHEALIIIKERSGSDNVHFLQLDLSSLESVREFSKKFHEIENRLDILVNNAGVFGLSKSLTIDGFESHMGINYLGPFLLTNLLLDLLKASAPSRIVIVSSDMHFFGSNLKKDLMSEKFYWKYKAYSNSKLANVLHGRYLAKQLEGSGVTVNSLNPGFVKTEASRHVNPILFAIAAVVFFVMHKSVNEGVQTQIKLACDPELETVSGKYFSDCAEKIPSKEALDDEVAEWLWHESLKLVEG